VAKRIPVLVGISDASYEESCALAAHARACGADAVVTAPPFYFALSQKDLLRLVQMLAARVEMPLYLYNMPRLTKCSFEPETVMRAAELPNVWGLKDSSGEIGYLRAITMQMRDRPDFAVLVGPEELLVESLRMGVHGGVCGGANLFPKLYVSLYEAACKEDLDKTRALQQRLREVGELLYGIGEAESSYLRGLKLGMEVMGLCKSTLAVPFESADARLHGALAEKLREYA
jgi:4-hydroxy-tetrahydrodipicolinate synthase